MIDFSKLKSLSIDGIWLKELKLGGIQIWKKGFKNLADVNSPDWLTDCRIKSDHSIVAQEGSTVTNFIPCSMGDVVRFKGAEINGQACSMFDSGKNIVSIYYPNADTGGNFTNGSVIDSIVAGRYNTYNFPNTAYMRFTVKVAGNPDDVIITVNEEIE